jgi:CheY-like chemotaxis protein
MRSPGTEDEEMERTILLVDDVRLFLEIQKEFLRNSSVNVITAKNGVDALHAVERQRPDLIFMDLEMPEMNGADCCRALKSNPASAGIPVVMITSRGDQASQGYCRSAGCDEFLTKPLSRNTFLETAGRFVKDIERREERKRVNLPGVIHARGTNLHCTVLNLSVGGAMLAADFQAELGRVLQISITLPDGSELQCRGKAVWSGAPRAGFGVSFILPSESTRGALAAFLTTVR